MEGFLVIKIELKKIKCICTHSIWPYSLFLKHGVWQILLYSKFFPSFQSQSDKTLSFFNIHSCFFVQFRFKILWWMLLPKEAHIMCLVSSLFVIVGGNARLITENKAEKNPHMIYLVMICPNSLSVCGFCLFALCLWNWQKHLQFFWNTVPLISHLTALKGFGYWREKSGYRNGVSGGVRTGMALGTGVTGGCGWVDPFSQPYEAHLRCGERNARLSFVTRPNFLIRHKSICWERWGALWFGATAPPSGGQRLHRKGHIID